MIVDLATKNPALVSLYEKPDQVITLDANFLIPPDRQMQSVKGIPFSLFQAFWLDPIFDTFPNLAIHEAVREELVSRDIKTFIQNKEDSTPPQIIIHKDSELTSVEQMLRDSVETKIYPHGSDTKLTPKLRIFYVYRSCPLLPSPAIISYLN